MFIRFKILFVAAIVRFWCRCFSWLLIVLLWFCWFCGVILLLLCLGWIALRLFGAWNLDFVLIWLWFAVCVCYVDYCLARILIVVVSFHWSVSITINALWYWYIYWYLSVVVCLLGWLCCSVLHAGVGLFCVMFIRWTCLLVWCDWFGIAVGWCNYCVGLLISRMDCVWIVLISWCCLCLCIYGYWNGVLEFGCQLLWFVWQTFGFVGIVGCVGMIVVLELVMDLFVSGCWLLVDLSGL